MAFDLENSNPATANAIRRTAKREIPSLAVTEVDFFKNTSTMFDEYIANRIGMVPLKTPETYKNSKKDENPSTILTLSAKGPEKVKASQMKPEDAEVEILYPDMPIIKLTEDQEIELEAKAELRKGKDHARHKTCFITYTTNTDEDAEKDSEENFHFQIESYTDTTPEEILTQTLEKIKEKTEEFKESLEEK